MDNLINQTLKGYHIYERIGEGGFGAVYRAFQPVIEREVAIKVILAEYANQPDFIRRFEAEAQLIAHLEHPNIVPLYDYWRQPDGAYLVLRWLRGGSLTVALKKERYDPEAAAKLLDQIAAALAIAHRNNVVHRDIKPDNILLDEDNNAYLTDFGISTIIGHMPESGDGISGTIRYIAPEQLKQEPDAITIDIYSLGIVMFEVLSGSHPFEEHTNAEILMKHLTEPLPDLHDIRPDLPESLSAVIHKATEKEPTNRYQSTLDMARAFRQALTTTSVVDEWAIDLVDLENPFKGLRAFQEADAADFFGRQSLIKQLTDALVDSRFLAVVGPSGSGKSSVVRAGLIPQLRDGVLPDSENWFFADMSPGAHPFDELEAALLGITSNPAVSFAQLLREHENGIAEAVRMALPTGDSQLVLVIDQFEEVFTMVEDETERRRFLNALSNAVHDAERCLRLIITLRADFYDRPLLYPGFGELLRANMKTVLPLSHTELEQVITYPIIQSGAKLEAGLAERVIQDVEEQPGALPLLQYALTELFERHENGMLTLRSYQELGGVLGALAQRAEQVYQSLDKPLREVSRQLFLRLVTLGEGANDTRRRVSREELSALDKEQLNRVLDVFGRARLLTFDVDPITRIPTVEVAHEALIRRWGQLHEWIETNREDIQLHRRLMAEAQDWLAAKQDAGFLATDARLEQYDNWAKTTSMVLNEHEQVYLSASLERRTAERQRDEARKARELELQQNANRRLRYLVASLAIFLVVALGLSGFALQQRNAADTARATSDANAEAALQALDLAEQRADEANSLALASQSMLELSEYNTDFALFLGLAANRLENPPLVSQMALLNAAYAPGTRHRCELDTVQAVAAAISPDGTAILTSTWDQTQPSSTFTLWDIETCTMRQQSTLPDSVVTAIAFMDDGSTVLYTTLHTETRRTGTIGLWDISAWEVTGEQVGLGYAFHLSIGSNQQIALVDYAQVGATVWELPQLRQIEEMRRPYYLSNVLSDNQTVLSADAETAVLWDIVTGDEIRRFEKPPEPLTVLAVSPDEKYALGGTQLATLVLWDMETGEIQQEFRGHGEEVIDIAFTPDAQQFLSASVDNSIRLWDIASGLDIYRFDGHRDAVRDIQLLPEQGWFISWSVDNTVRVWDLYNASQIRRYTGHNAGVNAVAVSPDGTLAASGDIGGELILWNVETGAILHEFDGVQFIHRITFSADGTHMLTAAFNGLFLHNTQTFELEWQVRESGFSDAQYSPDEQMIVATWLSDVSGGVRFVDAENGTILNAFNNTSPVYSGDFVTDDEFVFSAGSQACLFNAESGEQLRCFSGHTAEVGIVRVSPDSKVLLTASYDGTARLWDIATGDEILRLEGHSAPVFSAAFSEDGLTILTGSADGSVRLWNVETGAEIHRINWTAPVWNAAFRADTQMALVGSEDGLVSLWDISSPSSDALITWVGANRYVPSIPCEQLQTYTIDETCD